MELLLFPPYDSLRIQVEVKVCSSLRMYEYYRQ